VNGMTKRRKALGAEGEKAVKAFLEGQGYRILESNFRTRYGEIDIIAAVERTLVFVEVKTRVSSNCGIPEEAVNWRKQQRIRRLAVEYLSMPGHERFCDFRFDVAAVTANDKGEIEEINLYEAAF